MARNRIGGLIELRVTSSDGVSTQIPVRGSFTFTPSPTEKEGVAGQDGTHGYTEKPVVQVMECDVSYLSDIDVLALDNAKDITGTWTCANGKQWVGRDGWRAEKSEIDAEEGKFKLKIEFMSIDALN